MHEILLKMYIGLHVKYRSFLSDFDETRNFSPYIFEKLLNLVLRPYHGLSRLVASGQVLQRIPRSYPVRYHPTDAALLSAGRQRSEAWDISKK